MMSLGTITDSIPGESCIVELLASTTTPNGAPTADAGIEVNTFRRTAGRIPDAIRVGVNSTAGSGTITVAGKVWLRAGGDWYVAQALACDPATPQTPGTIGETDEDSISYSEWVFGLAGADRLYLELTSIGGTDAAVTGYAIVGR